MVVVLLMLLCANTIRCGCRRIIHTFVRQSLHKQRQLSALASEKPAVAVAVPVHSAYPCPVDYCSSIRKVRVVRCVKRSSLFFPLGSLSTSGSSTSSGCMEASFKDVRDEAASSLNKIARQMVLDGYTRRLMVHAFCDDDLALRTFFRDLDVAWVLDLEEAGKKVTLPELDQDRTAFDDLVERWCRALSVMIKVFHMTWSGLRDGKPACAFVVQEVKASLLSSALATVAAYSLGKKPGTAGAGHADEEPEAQLARFSHACVLRMLAVADAIAGADRAKENLLWTLDVYAAVSDSAPLLLQTLASAGSRSRSNKAALAVKIESTSLLLSDAVFGMIKDLQASIVERVLAQPDAPPGCGLLDTVRGTMDDITLLFCNYRRLSVFLQQYGDGCIFHLEDDDDRGSCTFGDLVLQLVSCLEYAIEKKYRVYSDPLRCMLLLNNLHFVLERVEALDLSPQRDRMGEPAGRKSFRKQKIERYINAYLISSWLPVASCLSSSRTKGRKYKVDGAGRSSSPLDKFYSEFQRTYTTQKLWKVPNPQQRRRLRETISKRVIQDYSTYLLHNRSSGGPIMYSPEEMRQLLAELFEG